MLVRARVFAAIAAAAVIGLAVDGWLRFWALPLRRGDRVARARVTGVAMRAWGRSFLALATGALGIKVAVEGPPPPPGRYLVVSNHQSSLDIPLLITTLRDLDLKFVAMEKLRTGSPAISLVLREGGSVFVGKTNVGQDLAALARFAAGLEAIGGSPVIFPAGGLQRGHDTPGFFLAGLEVVRRAARLPILPIAIEGWRAAPSVGFFHRIVGARVTLRLHPPIPCEDADADPRGFGQRLEEAIYGAVDDLRRAHETRA